MEQKHTDNKGKFIPGFGRVLMGFLAVLAISTTAYAEKPDKENGKGNSGKNKQEQQDRKGNQKEGRGDRDERQGRDDRDDRKFKGDKSAGKQQKDSGLNTSVDFGFRSDDTRLVREYYGSQAAKGNCPPGLAKKGNGCQPPGQAKKWQRGQPLGKDMRYYDIPNELRLRLPNPPLDHRYVQYGTDVLLIQAGTAIVVDAITNIF
jgi:Ni/Co efflux regulator RcnB